MRHLGRGGTVPGARNRARIGVPLAHGPGEVALAQLVGDASLRQMGIRLLPLGKASATVTFDVTRPSEDGAPGGSSRVSGRVTNIRSCAERSRTLCRRGGLPQPLAGPRRTSERGRDTRSRRRLHPAPSQQRLARTRPRHRGRLNSADDCEGHRVRLLAVDDCRWAIFPVFVLKGGAGWR